MQVTITLPPELPMSQRTRLARGFLGGVVVVNRCLLRKGLIPPLFRSGVVYGEQLGPEEFPDALVTLRRGIGDCAPLSCWRVAELQELHDARIKAGLIHPRTPPPQLTLYTREGPRTLTHVQVRHAPTEQFPAGRIEDPSRMLGMAEL